MTRVRLYVDENVALLIFETVDVLLVDGFRRLAVSIPGGNESDEGVL